MNKHPLMAVLFFTSFFAQCFAQEVAFEHFDREKEERNANLKLAGIVAAGIVAIPAGVGCGMWMTEAGRNALPAIVNLNAYRLLAQALQSIEPSYEVMLWVGEAGAAGIAQLTPYLAGPIIAPALILKEEIVKQLMNDPAVIIQKKFKNPTQQMLYKIQHYQRTPQELLAIVPHRYPLEAKLSEAKGQLKAALANLLPASPTRLEDIKKFDGWRDFNPQRLPEIVDYEHYLAQHINFIKPFVTRRFVERRYRDVWDKIEDAIKNEHYWVVDGEIGDWIKKKLALSTDVRLAKEKQDCNIAECVNFITVVSQLYALAMHPEMQDVFKQSQDQLIKERENKEKKVEQLKANVERKKQSEQHAYTTYIESEQQLQTVKASVGSKNKHSSSTYAEREALQQRIAKLRERREDIQKHLQDQQTQIEKTIEEIEELKSENTATVQKLRAIFE